MNGLTSDRRLLGSSPIWGQIMEFGVDDRIGAKSISTPLGSSKLFSFTHDMSVVPAGTVVSSLSAGQRLLCKKEIVMSHEAESACIEACNDCAVACNHCAAACLKEDDVSMMSKCIALDMDCAAICQFAAAALARGSGHANEICQLCADICEACAEECEKHGAQHCQACAKACRACAVACLEMAH